jgi:hypothetical protein
MRIDDNDVPHIQAQCSSCGFLYDLKFGLSCPACNGIGVRWARLLHCATCGDTGNINGEPCIACGVPTTYHSYYPGRLSSPYSHTAGEEQDLAELNKMYNLEDTRRN